MPKTTRKFEPIGVTTDTSAKADVNSTGPTALARYDAMCAAIAECAKVDEIKDIRDRAKALEEYNRQAQNHEAERQAAEIRLRAERRAGELLAEMSRAKARSKGGRPRKTNTTGEFVSPEEKPAKRGRKKTNSLGVFVSENGSEKPNPLEEPALPELKDLGISAKQSATWQQLAAIPEAEFEAGLQEQERPTTAGLIRAHTETTPARDADGITRPKEPPGKVSTELTSELRRALICLDCPDADGALTALRRLAAILSHRKLEPEHISVSIRRSIH
jgi:hypothetical protein